MGLFDDMAQAAKEEHEKPDGWITIREYMAMAGGKLSRPGAQRQLQASVECGRAEMRKWLDPDTGKKVNIYREAKR